MQTLCSIYQPRIIQILIDLRWTWVRWWTKETIWNSQTEAVTQQHQIEAAEEDEDRLRTNGISIGWWVVQGRWEIGKTWWFHLIF